MILLIALFTSVASALFTQNQVFFTTAFPHSLASSSDKCNFNCGVCHVPKYDEDQDKYLAIGDVYGAICR